MTPTILAALLIGGLAAPGSATAATPTPNPTPSTTADTSSDLKPPAVTVPQLKVIIDRISAVATKADANKDVDLAKTRFAGAALDLRAANYAVRKVDDAQPPLAAIPSGEVKIVVPQQTRTWPRTVFTVILPKDKTIAPTALMLEQTTPRDVYKVRYAMSLEASAQVPKLAAASIGAPQLPGDTKLLQLEPQSIALSYGNILDKGATSESMKLFNTGKDALISVIGLDARKALQAKLSANASMVFANVAGPYSAIALGSNDSGAVVAVYLTETVTVTPTEAGSAVNTEGAVKSLSGVTGSTKGTVSVYGDQMLFYVPSALKTDEKATLLGFATGLVSANELP